jgi:hypothetical protein
MIKNFSLLLIAMLLTFNYVSAEESVRTQESGLTSEIKYKDNATDQNISNSLKTIPIVIFFLLFIVTALFFLKPVLLKHYLKDIASSDRIKLSEIKRMPHNVILYLIEIDRKPVLLIKNGNSISSMSVDMQHEESEQQGKDK